MRDREAVVNASRSVRPRMDVGPHSGPIEVPEPLRRVCCNSRPRGLKGMMFRCGFEAEDTSHPGSTGRSAGLEDGREARHQPNLRASAELHTGPRGFTRGRSPCTCRSRAPCTVLRAGRARRASRRLSAPPGRARSAVGSTRSTRRRAESLYTA